MPVTIEPAEAVTELKLGAVNVRRASGRELDPAGQPIPQGRILVAAVLRRHAGGVDGQDLDPINTPDVAAWVAAMAQAADPLAAEAAVRFERVNDDLKWLTALRGSQLGVCGRPNAGG